MTEVYLNEFLAALDGSANDDDLTLTLTEAPPAAGLGGTWRIRIGELPTVQDEEPDYEIVLVDGPSTSGTVVTVTRGAEGTTAQAWSDGTPVAAVLTAAGLVAVASAAPGFAELHDRPPENGARASYFLDFMGALSGDCPLIVNGVTTAPIPSDADENDVLAIILAAVPSLAGHITVVVD